MSVVFFSLCVRLNGQVEIGLLRAQLEASNKERDQLRAILNASLKGSVLRSEGSNAVDNEEDDEDEMDMEGGEGGSSSGGAVVEQFRFGSTGETFVKRKGASDAEARCFTADQGREMAQYVQTISPAPPRAAAGGTATNFEEAMDQSLDLARQFSEECKRLTAKCAKLEKKAKRPQGKVVEVLEVVVCVCVRWISL